MIFSHWIGGNQQHSEQRRKADQKLLETAFFDCHLLPISQQLAIENFVSNDFLSTFIDSINVFDCHLSSVILVLILTAKPVNNLMPHFNPPADLCFKKGWLAYGLLDILLSSLKPETCCIDLLKKGKKCN